MKSSTFTAPSHPHPKHKHNHPARATSALLLPPILQKQRPEHAPQNKRHKNNHLEHKSSWQITATLERQISAKCNQQESASTRPSLTPSHNFPSPHHHPHFTSSRCQETALKKIFHNLPTFFQNLPQSFTFSKTFQKFCAIIYL